MTINRIIHFVSHGIAGLLFSQFQKGWVADKKDNLVRYDRQGQSEVRIRITLLFVSADMAALLFSFRNGAGCRASVLAIIIGKVRT